MKKLTERELETCEIKKQKAAEIYRKNQEKGPGPVTQVDVARIAGMSEKDIADLFGEDKRIAKENKTGTGEEYEPKTQ